MYVKLENEKFYILNLCYQKVFGTFWTSPRSNIKISVVKLQRSRTYVGAVDSLPHQTWTKTADDLPNIRIAIYTVLASIRFP